MRGLRGLQTGYEGYGDTYVTEFHEFRIPRIPRIPYPQILDGQFDALPRSADSETVPLANVIWRILVYGLCKPIKVTLSLTTFANAWMTIMLLLHVIIVLGVMYWFYYKSEDGGQSGLFWGLIGVFSYAIPAFVCLFLVVPSVFRQYATNDNILALMVLGTALPFALGIGCCLLARKALVRAIERQRPQS